MLEQLNPIEMHKKLHLGRHDLRLIIWMRV